MLNGVYHSVSSNTYDVLDLVSRLLDRHLDPLQYLLVASVKLILGMRGKVPNNRHLYRRGNVAHSYSDNPL